MPASPSIARCVAMNDTLRHKPTYAVEWVMPAELIRSPRRRVAEKTKARQSPVPSPFSYSERARTLSVVRRASQTASYPVGSCVREWRCAGICHVCRRHRKGDLPLPRIDGLPKLWADDI